MARCGSARSAWSGSWRITVEQDQLDAVRVTGGFNPFDFGYVLQPGEKLETPVFYGGYSRTMASAAPRGCCIASSSNTFCRARKRQGGAADATSRGR